MNVRLTIMLVFVLALFGALALWFKPWEQDTRREDEPWAWRIDDDAIVHIEVTNRGQTGRSLECSDRTIEVAESELSVTYDKDLGRGRWYIVEGDERSEVYQQRWAGTPLLLSGPRVDRVLGETIENPAQYGLAPPESVIKITEETGLSYEFWLGNATPDEGYNYMQVSGSQQLFTVPEIWARVVNCLAVNPPFIPPPLELGYFYEADFRDIKELEVTHNGATVSYAPEAGLRTWHATSGDERTEVKPPEWWTSQLQWLAQPSKPGGPDTPGGWHVDEEGASDPKYGLQPPQTTVRIVTHEKTHEFYIGTGHTEVDENGQPILDDQGNTQVVVNYAGLPDDPIVYVINRVRAERTACLATDPPVSAPYECP